MTVNENSKPLLTVKGLKQYFKVSNNYTVHAVENVSFQIYPGETYGLVGESGSGKSTIGRSIIRLYDPTAGEINFYGMDISGRINKANSQALRTQMQMIFQDPMASLNPRKKVRDIIGEGLDIHHMYKTRAEREEKIKNILAKVGLAPEHAGRYPHQFSGGQRQRVGIARALIMNPKLIIADECISALDVSIQAQVVNLMKDIQQETGTAYLFIAHDLSMVKYISDRIGVLHPFIPPHVQNFPPCGIHGGKFAAALRFSCYGLQVFGCGNFGSAQFASWERPHPPTAAGTFPLGESEVG